MDKKVSQLKEKFVNGRKQDAMRHLHFLEDGIRERLTAYKRAPNRENLRKRRKFM